MKRLFFLIVALFAISTLSSQEVEWQSQFCYGEGMIDPHFAVMPYSSAEAVADRDIASSPYYQSLNGSWKFYWVKGVDSRVQDFYEPTRDVSYWDDITVPGSWERQGYGLPIYVNYTYEWDEHNPTPPTVPVDRNEVGSYRREFSIPSDWSGRRVILSLDGVRSFYYIWVNGKKLGYSTDSKTESQWDITDIVNFGGENTVAVEVYRWSSGSYLECQDFWRLSGIERDVFVYSTPKDHIADYTVTADLDRDSYSKGILNVDAKVVGTGELSYRLLDDKGEEVFVANATAGYSFPAMEIPSVKPWSAEHPNLYTLVLELKDSKGNITHTTGSNIGFRSIELTGGQVLVNGQPVLFKGVNRHEHTQMGHYVSEESMIEDIKLMKQGNINAVRNCHYPTSRRWYELCDKYGIYMIDEANVESHGMGYDEKSLAKDTTWLPAQLFRTKRMYHRSKNNPAVIFYSLGNEAGDGITFQECYAWLKSVERVRPVQYEGAGENAHTDIFCPMYASIERMEEYLATDPSRPIIQCEYAHAMGNSVGAVADYWDLIYSEPKAQGAFIWDWVDQAFEESDDKGVKYMVYGGDYGPEGVPSSDNFCINGLISAFREPHPHYFEVKAVYQNIDAKLVEVGGEYKLEIHNGYFFTDLNSFTLKWSLMGDLNREYNSGEMVVDCAPGETATIELPAIARESISKEMFINLSWIDKEGSDVVPMGHEVAFNQFRVEGVAPADPHIAGGYSRLTTLKNSYGVANNVVSIRFSSESGALTSYRYSGNEYLKEPLLLDFYRPATDNDIVDRGTGQKLWKEAGLDSLTHCNPEFKCQIYKGVAYIDVTTDILNTRGEKLFDTTIKYVLNPSGELSLVCSVVPDSSIVKSVARVGLKPVLLAAYSEVSYFGRDTESYVDRTRAGRISYNKHDIKDMVHNYVVPQSSGNRMDVRWAMLRDGYQGGLIIKSTNPFQFSASPYDDMEVDKARHTNEINYAKKSTLHLDYLQSGVGTATCGPGVLKKYQVEIKPWEFSFTFIPFSGGDPLELL